MDGRQNGGCDGLGSLGNMQMDPLNASHCQSEMKVVVEGVFEAKKYVQHLDPTKIIPDGRRFHGPAEKLGKTTNGVYGGWKRRPSEVNAKSKVAAELGAQIGIGAFGKSLQSR